jgi:hypothetical protein
VPDLAWLRHPSERSRLVLAVAASVILAGLAVVLFVKRLERDQVIWTMAAGPALLGLGWVVLQITRAQLLGNAVRVTRGRRRHRARDRRRRAAAAGGRDDRRQRHGKPDPALALLDHVPPSFAGSCLPGEGIQGPLGRRLSASVVCTAAAPASVDYYQYGDRRAMQAAFDGITKGVKDAGCGKDATYEGGRYACWRFKGASVMAWTDEKRLIVALAVGRGMQPHELLRWWQLDSGPI